MTDHPMVTRRVRIDTLHEDPGNVRRHGAKNLAAIRDSLKAFGQVEPLVVQSRSGLVIGGNGRLTVMRQMGWQECDVVEIDVDDTKAARIGIALNRTSELAEWDPEGLAQLVQTLSDSDQLDGLGFDALDLAKIATSLDVPDFSAASLDEQSSLDSKKTTICPNCHHEW